MPYVAGNEIHAHCASCGRDREHTVMEVHDGVVFQVRCKSCAAVHAYQKPHSAPPARPRAAAGRAKGGPRKKAAPRPKVSPWAALVDGRDPETARLYGAAERFAPEELITHPKFGLGVVTGAARDKIDVEFEDGSRKLVHGRG